TADRYEEGTAGADRTTWRSGTGATVAFVIKKRLHQARRWPFERDGKRLLPSGASRREAARPTFRLGAVDDRLRVCSGRTVLAVRR
ncbi:MAG: hypothetical protein CL472_05410, partial [Acidobacteria bacterium]|nr:hypothetical protein [Acidobacteriota bacterium]